MFRNEETHCHVGRGDGKELTIEMQFPQNGKRIWPDAGHLSVIA